MSRLILFTMLKLADNRVLKCIMLKKFVLQKATFTYYVHSSKNVVLEPIEGGSGWGGEGLVFNIH